MKQLVVTKQNGDIVAIGPHPDEMGPEGGGARRFGFLPLDGQQVHSVEFPPELAAVEQMMRLHHTHRIEIVEGAPTLVAKHATS